MRTYGIFELLGVFSVAPAQAQSDTSKVEAYGGYDYIRFNINANVSGVPPAESINLNGGSGQLEYNASNKLGIVSDLGGYYGSTAGGGRGGAFSYLFGPRLNLRGDKFTTFAQLLAGGFLSTSGIGSPGPQNHFALSAGGGLDFKVSRLISIQPAQAEYFLTTIPDGLNIRHRNRLPFWPPSQTPRERMGISREFRT